MLNIDAILLYTPTCLIFILITSYFVGYLKLKLNIKTNYTRKIFHIAFFTFAGIISIFGDFSGVLIYGGISTLFIIIILILGDGNIFYEGIAREEDKPYRSFYILMPLISTIAGGLLGNYFFGTFAIIGYFVAGWGDAVGEPIGVRFGKHKYKVPSLTKNKSIRSFEGSIGVLIVSTIISMLILLYVLKFSLRIAIINSIIIGVSACLIEAITPHGIDNFTIQLFPLVGAYWW